MHVRNALWLCICMVMYVWLCMWGYVCRYSMVMHIYGYVCMVVYVGLCMYVMYV